MKTFRVYLRCYVDIEANSPEEAEEVVSEMDYSFSQDDKEFASEIYDLEEVKERNP